MQIAYVSGFFDGEGSISILKQTDQARPTNFYHVLKVSVANGNREVLNEFQALFGGNIYTRKSHEGLSRAYVWSVAAKEADVFLKKVRSHVMVKKTQTEIAIRFRNTFRNWWHVIPQSVLDERESLRKELMKINNRKKDTSRFSIPRVV